MDLIDRYLHALRDYLPLKGQDDVLTELGHDLRTQAADREEELGRPLTADDQAALLKPFGHPMALAAEYRPTRHLISPVLLPFYFLGLKIAMGIAVVVQVAIAVVMIANGESGAAVIGRLASFPFTGLVTLFGWITLAFIAVDVHVRQVVSRATGTWDPRRLTDPPKELLPKPFWSAAADLGFSTIALIWWVAIPRTPWLVFGPAATFLAMAPAWQLVHMPLAALWLAGLVARWALLFRPDLKDLRFALELGSSVVGVLVAFYLLRAGNIVVQMPGVDAGADAANLARLVHVIDVAAHVGVFVWLCASIWEAVQTILRRRRSA